MGRFHAGDHPPHDADFGGPVHGNNAGLPVPGVARAIGVNDNPAPGVIGVNDNLAPGAVGVNIDPVPGIVGINNNPILPGDDQVGNANDDYNQVGNADENDDPAADTGNPGEPPVQGDDKKIPKPRNMWIFYRIEKHKEIVAEHPEMHTSQICKFLFSSQILIVLTCHS